MILYRQVFHKYFLAPIEFFLIGTLLVGGVYWGWLRWENHKEYVRQEKIAEILAKATDIHHHGDPREAILLWAELKNLVSKAKEPRLYAGAVASSAWDNFSTCTVKGKLVGIEIFKTYINEEKNAPADIMANMVMSMLDIFNGTHDSKYLQAIFASGEPWQTFFRQAHGSGRLAERLAYEWTLSMYPTALAHYRIAYWYGEQILKNTRLSPDKIADYTQKIAVNTKAGDALFKRDFNELLAKSETRAVFLSLLRAVSHRWLFAAGQESPERVDQLFKETSGLITKYLGKDKDDRHLRDSSFEFAYQYASFLIDTFGRSRRDDIVVQAEKIAEGVRATTYKGGVGLFALLAKNEYLTHNPGATEHGKNLAQHEAHYPDYNELLGVARFSPALQLALIEIGWPKNLFAFR